VAIEGFCGPGGLSLGLSRVGFDIRAAFDIDQRSIETYRKNMGGHGFLGDARELTGDALRTSAGLASGQELDLFAGGPPCQGFSKQKRGAHLGDDRNALVLEYLRLLHELSPRAFLLENVPQLAGVRGEALVAEFGSTLPDYVLTAEFYTAADYGVAQTRQRFVIVGIRQDVEGGFLKPVPTTPDWPTVRDVLSDMPEPPLDYSEHPKYANHQAARVTPLNVERFSHVPEGGGWQDIPERLRLKCHQNVDTSKGGWPDVYGRLRWDGQCPTITGGFDSFTRGRYGHPGADRPLTPREAARLQGFPDHFVFCGTRHDVRHQIGNAVPPPMAEAIGASISAALEGRTPREVSPWELTLFQLEEQRAGAPAGPS
jgi:DNA (cytosine-5)-methyltransferase 1